MIKLLEENILLKLDTRGTQQVRFSRQESTFLYLGQDVELGGGAVEDGGDGGEVGGAARVHGQALLHAGGPGKREK